MLKCPLGGEGATEVLDFTSRKTGKPFNARLVLRGKKIKYDFGNKGKKNTFSVAPSNNERTQDTHEVHIRIDSSKSGTVVIKVGKPIRLTRTINYGLVPARMAECLGCMTAARLVKHHFGKESIKQRISFSINDKSFSRYLLRERTARDKEINSAVHELWKLLKAFSSWEAQYTPRGRAKLKGSPQADNFPHKIFPWLNAKLEKQENNTYVYLPLACPDVIAQFIASIRSAKRIDENSFVVPHASENVVKAWLYKVKGGPAQRPPQNKKEEV